MDTGCPQGGDHEVITASFEDRDRYDPTILGKYDQYAGPRPNQLWGYCSKCLEGMRWSVGDQQWRRWPGGLGLLPHFMDEEMDELRDAIVRRMQELAKVVELAQNPDTVDELLYKVQILMSLHTAVQEARYNLWPPEGTYAPRAWGEAWTVLGAWIDTQIAGIGRSSPTDAGYGAMAAFEAAKKKVAELERAGNDSIGAIRAAEVRELHGSLAELSEPQPTPADSD